jgi:hypothetical protein
VAELCSFLGGLLDSVTQMRIVRDVASLAWYTLLVVFSTLESADDCYLGLNGRPVRLRAQFYHYLGYSLV